jgi:hypothetical protein
MTKATRKAGKKMFLLAEGKLDALGEPIVAVGILVDPKYNSHMTLRPGRLIGQKVKLWIERVG